MKGTNLWLALGPPAAFRCVFIPPALYSRRKVHQDQFGPDARKEL
jgi:hypothetical protein